MQALRKCNLLFTNLSKKINVHVQSSFAVVRFTSNMSAGIQHTVNTKWLNGEIEKGNKNLVVLDTSWYRFMDGQNLYSESHIPGAQHFDLNACGQSTQLIPRSVPEPAALQQYLRSLGVNKDSHVVVYDRDDFIKMISAAVSRTWWTFRMHGLKNVSVLDGGLVQWIKDGFPTKTGKEPKAVEGNFEVKIDKSLVKNFEEMKKIVEDGSYQIADTRREDDFNGSSSEPSEVTKITCEDVNVPVPEDGSMIGGHMTNAKNIPYSTLFQPESSNLLSKEEYLKLFQKVGITLDKPLLSTCYVGHTACIFALAAAVCGKDDVPVYPGSWTEWGQRMK